jgi:hypothetical protein
MTHVRDAEQALTVGLYKSNPVNPQPESAWFQSLEPMK